MKLKNSIASIILCILLTSNLMAQEGIPAFREKPPEPRMVPGCQIRVIYPLGNVLSISRWREPGHCRMDYER